MDDLKPTQIVLLCLLVSFITSIGTGIITSTLLQEAPQNVTQTINRVVERTVQTIVPEGNSSPSVVTKETTVVVKEEDLVIDAIKNSRANLAWIMGKDSFGQIGVRTIGVVVKKDGTILTDKRYINLRGSYTAKFFDGSEYPVSVLVTSKKTNAVFLKLDTSSAPSRTFSPAPLADSDSVQLGQSVIAMGGKDKEAVSIGRIISINPVAGQTSTSTKVNATIETDSPLKDLLPGSILLNLNGALVGYESYDPDTGKEGLYTAINLIKQENTAQFEPK